MFQEETARLLEFIPNGIEPQSLPITDLSDLFHFIGLLVVGGFIGLWLLYKIALCVWCEIKHWRNK